MILTVDWSDCMKVADIKKLPKEFDFKSNNSSFGIIYHAKETKHNYEVTWDLGSHIANCTYTKEGFRRNLLCGAFEVCQ